MRNALVIAVLALTGCPDEPPDRFECHIDEQCVEDGEKGYCEISNDCSFDDLLCNSQRRYASLSGLPGECVDTGVSPSLVTNGGFEDGVTGWEGDNAEITPSIDPHSLDASVKVCRVDDTVPSFALVDTQASAFDPQDGDQLTARAWVKAAEGEGETLLRFVFHPTGTGDDGANDTETEPPVVASSAWQEVTVPHQVGDPIDRLFVMVEGEQEPGTESCFLIDDVAVFRLP